MEKGSNLPGFQALQLDFAAYIRNPERNPLPEGIEARRMEIYADLFYRNIEGFLSSTFRVFRSITTDTEWHDLVRRFVHRHRSASPYFIQIPEEFLEFLSDEAPADVNRPFRLELCHYEWVELALDFREDEPVTYLDGPIDAAHLDDSRLRLSPYAWPLQYQFPVHLIGPKNQPAFAPEHPTYLIVYRNADDRVKFMESNAATFRLLQHLDDAGGDLTRTIAAVADELGQPRAPRVETNVLSTFERLRQADVLAVREVEE